MSGATCSKSIILFGLKNSNKSVYGQLLSKHFEVPFYDTDYVIQKMTGLSPLDVYSKQGIASFMMAEEEACRKILEVTKNKNVIISTGNGICDNYPALNELRTKGDFYFLKTEAQPLAEQILKNVMEPSPGVFSNVPLYIAEKKPESLQEIEQLLVTCFSDRLHIYETIADTVIEIKKASQKEIFNSILEAL